MYGSQVGYLLDGITKMLLTSVGRYSGSTWRLMTLPQCFRVSSPRIPDHCRVYALSDPKDSDYQSTCLHHHDDRCGQCSRLYFTIEEIEKAIQKTAIAPEVHDELNFFTEKAKREVSA